MSDIVINGSHGANFYPERVVVAMEKSVPIPSYRNDKLNRLINALFVHVENRRPFLFDFSNKKYYRIKLTGVFISLDGKNLIIRYDQMKIKDTPNLDIDFLFEIGYENLVLLINRVEHETYERVHPVIEYPEF